MTQNEDKYRFVDERKRERETFIIIYSTIIDIIIRTEREREY